MPLYNIYILGGGARDKRVHSVYGAWIALFHYSIARVYVCICAIY